MSDISSYLTDNDKLNRLIGYLQHNKDIILDSAHLPVSSWKKLTPQARLSLFRLVSSSPRAFRNINLAEFCINHTSNLDLTQKEVTHGLRCWLQAGGFIVLQKEDKSSCLRAALIPLLSYNYLSHSLSCPKAWVQLPMVDDEGCRINRKRPFEDVEDDDSEVEFDADMMCEIRNNEWIPSNISTGHSSHREQQNNIRDSAESTIVRELDYSEDVKALVQSCKDYIVLNDKSSKYSTLLSLFVQLLKISETIKSSNYPSLFYDINNSFQFSSLSDDELVILSESVSHYNDVSCRAALSIFLCIFILEGKVKQLKSSSTRTLIKIAQNIHSCCPVAISIYLIHRLLLESSMPAYKPGAHQYDFIRRVVQQAVPKGQMDSLLEGITKSYKSSPDGVNDSLHSHIIHLNAVYKCADSVSMTLDYMKLLTVLFSLSGSPSSATVSTLLQSISNAIVDFKDLINSPVLITLLNGMISKIGNQITSKIKQDLIEILSKSSSLIAKSSLAMLNKL